MLVCVPVLRIVSTDKILHFIITLLLGVGGGGGEGQGGGCPRPRVCV